jgi:hypothetical protein
MTLKIRYIQKEHSDLIKEDLVPQFLGLWAKMYQSGIPADIAKRGMALALFRTAGHLRETKNLSDDGEVRNMIEEIGEILVRYEHNGMHYGKISAGLEFLITLVLGTSSEEDYDD